MDLVCRDRRSPEQRQSYMGERPLLCCSGCPVFALHHAVVRRGAAKRDAISLIVGPHAGEGAAASDSTFEMINVRWFEIGACRLIVIAVLVEPRNRVRAWATVRRFVVVRDGRGQFCCAECASRRLPGSEAVTAEVAPSFSQRRRSNSKRET